MNPVRGVIFISAVTMALMRYVPLVIVQVALTPVLLMSTPAVLQFAAISSKFTYMGKEDSGNNIRE